jgi:hypothetical protein
VRVPLALLRTPLTVEAFEGSGAHGPRFAEPVVIRSSVQPTNRLVLEPGGRTLAIDALAVIRPEAGPVRPESRVHAEDVTYRVVRCYAMPDPLRPSSYELSLAKIADTGAAVGSGS